MTMRSDTLPIHGTMQEVSPASDTCQRWANQKHTWVRRSEGGFDSRRYDVTPINETDAKTFITTHHYSGTYPAASKRYGLYDTTLDRLLVGVAVFSIPAQAKVLTNVFDLEPYTESLELGRFCLLSGDTTAPPSNAESWFLARCYEHLADDGIRGIVSFADPVPRVVDGQLLFPGHIGLIYQASNAIYTGRGTARTLTVLPDGTSLSDRALQKVRAQERGHEYVERRLIAMGATAPKAGFEPTLWLTEALNAARAVRIRHAGNLRYAMVTNKRDRRHLKPRPAPQPYPKHVDNT